MANTAITLTAGMRKNLFSLQNTQSLLERTQGRLASGMRVNSAVDDPVNYFTALGHRQRAEDLAARKDEMSESVQLVMAANQGVESITALIASAKSLAQSALSGATTEELSTLATQYNEVLQQIDKIADDSLYKGVNLLGGTGVTHEVKFNENGSSSLTMTGFDAKWNGDTLDLDEALAGTGANADVWATVTTSYTPGMVTNAANLQTSAAPNKATINAAITKLDAAREALRTEAKKLSTNLSTITIRQDFTKGMINTLQDGAAELTNADMNEEGANMLMLQTRQTLGTTSLSLASQAAQSVLRLF